jgi:hypothetical protein
MKHIFSTFLYLALNSVAIFSPTFSNAETAAKYDIIYVRYDIDVDEDPERPSYLTMPQGEKPYEIEDGADLVLLKYNADTDSHTEQILVNCETCSVMDPTISFDAKTVYYSLITEGSRASSSWIYKIELEAPYTPIRLTFDDGFDSKLYVANTTDEHVQGAYRGIRDMAPIPLSNGRLLFTSNRSALTALNPETSAIDKGSVQQLFTMEDHDGELTTAALSQITRLETGTIHLAQHPIQLKDGRILFSSWQDVGTRFRYAMTSLFTVNPDGTDLQQFTEPHDHSKRVEHFITQLPDEQVVSAYYYPSFDFGYGILLRYPITTEGEPDFLREHSDDGVWQDNKEFSRKGTENITPHTIASDNPAPVLDGEDEPEGKYSMPSVTDKGDLLVAFSQGYVNHFHASCNSKNICEDLRSGIYLLQYPATTKITSKDQLIMIKDDPLYNELWPKPVLTYQQLFGVTSPDIINSPLNQADIKEISNSHIKTGQAVGLVGTSSMYNRQSSPSLIENDPDAGKFQSSTSREIHKGNWTIQGADAGVYSNDDIYGVRIISTPAKPFTKPIDKYKERDRWESIKPYLQDKRLDRVVARYGSFHGERWEILGEFPLLNKATTDEQGNPDTSWVAKLPAETPFLIQTIDQNGMTLNSELTWRGLKSGEVRTDCGGCHAHSIEPLEFSTSEAYRSLHLPHHSSSTTGISGLVENEARVNNGIWDLTTNLTPLITGAIDKPAVTFVAGSMVGVEFNRDIAPLIETHCVSCHHDDQTDTTLLFTGTSVDVKGTDALTPYLTLKATGKPSGGAYTVPQKSHYIRTNQARQSLLTWVVWGERLDGRSNDSDSTDIDYSTEIHDAHKDLTLSDDEKRQVARWIDLGSPINFPQTDGMGYTDDNQLPIINISMSDDRQRLSVGLLDAHSAIDWSSVKVSIYPVDIGDASPLCIKPKYSDQINGINIYNISLANYVGQIIEVQVLDEWGNKNVATKKITLTVGDL